MYQMIRLSTIYKGYKYLFYDIFIILSFFFFINKVSDNIENDNHNILEIQFASSNR